MNTVNLQEMAVQRTRKIFRTTRGSIYPRL